MQVIEQPRLEGVTEEMWRGLFPGHPDPLAMMRLMQDCGMEGMEFGHILVRNGDRAILLLPLFEVRFRLASLVDGMVGRIVGTLSRLLPGVFSPKLLGVGLVEGEWGQVGVAADVDPATLGTAWKLAIDALQRRARSSRAGLTVFLNFTPSAADALPAELSRSLARIDTIPCARLKINFANLDEYLARLSKATRKDLRRKMKSAEQIRIIRTTEIDPWLDRIEMLYRQTLDRAELSLGVQRPSFFQQVCKTVPGAHYVLYFHEDELLAFNLLMEHRGELIDKYFCMDEKAGRELSLYFISWMENIRHCCASGLQTYHAGPGAEATKARLGASFVPSITLFRHRNPLVHRLLSLLRPLLAYHPATESQSQQ